MDALILAGGENRRLPVIKGFIEINGKKIIESSIELLSRIFGRVIISTNNPELYFYLGTPMVGDIVRYRGPIAGIFSTLISLDVPEIFVTACDMPFINPDLARHILHRWKENAESRIQETLNTSPASRLTVKKNWDALVPVFDNRPQPLLGVYSREIVPSMEKNIKMSLISLREFLKSADVSYITEDEVRAIDPDGKSFVNINTPEDFEKEIGGKYVWFGNAGIDNHPGNSSCSVWCNKIT